MNDAGRIGFVLKGDYNPATTYEMLDVVHYGHNSYAAKQTTTGNLPTNTTYWQPITDGEFITATDYATASTAGLVKPDGSTMVVGSNGVISSKGGTIAATVNPSGTQYAANWLMVNGTVITPEADKLYRVTISGNEMLYFWNGTEYEVISGGSAAGVSSFNSRTGAVTPTAGDYTPDQVGAMGLAGEILIDGSTNLPYDFNSYNGSKAGNYYRLSSTAMSNAPTGMSEKQFKMIVEQLKDSHDLNQQCKQTVIFSGFDEDTDAKEFYRYLKMVFVENGGVQSGNLEWSAWKEQGEGGVKSFNGRQGVVTPQSGDYTAAQVGAIASTDKGANGGVAELSNSGKVPVSQLPAMVGASGSTAGTAGAVPAPTAGDQNKVLSGGGLWVPQPTDMISDAWTTGKLYKVGEYCISNNTLYKCNTEHTSAAGYAPPYSYWDDVTVGEELSSLNSGLIDDYADFTAPSITDSRYQIIKGGYKQVGKAVYVHMIAKLLFSPSAESSIGMYDSFLNIPVPAEQANFILDGIVLKQDTYSRKMYHADCRVKIYPNVAGSNAWIQIGYKDAITIDTSNVYFVNINGMYFAK